MRRRNVIKWSVGALFTTPALVGQSTAQETGELPNENVPYTLVNPWGPSTVEAGDWLLHNIGWVDAEGEDASAEDVRRWLDKVEMTASIDGTEIEDPMQYWGEIQYFEDHSTWGVWWEYATPPKEVGDHSCTITFTYPDGFYDDGETVREPGQTNSFRNEYEVVPRQAGDSD